MVSSSVVAAPERSIAMTSVEKKMHLEEKDSSDSLGEKADERTKGVKCDGEEFEDDAGTGSSRFRRRRLSLPTYQLPSDDAEEAAVAAVSNATDNCCDSSQGSQDENSVGNTEDEPSNTSATASTLDVQLARQHQNLDRHKERVTSDTSATNHHEEPREADKSRKRPRSSSAESSSPSSTSRSPTTTRRRKKRRVRSMKHMHMMQGVLCRIRNRLLRTHPSNGVSARGARTAARPRLGSRSNSLTTLNHDDEEDATIGVFDHSHSPFSRDVVGTCSCHGIEPVYTEEAPGDDESDEDYKIEQKNPEGEDTDDSSASSSAVCSREDVTRQVDGAAKQKEQADEETATTLSDQKDEDAGTAVSEERMSVVAKINQDRGGVAYPYANDLHTALFAAYDGHGEGGEHVAHFVMTEIQRRLEKHVDFESNIKKAFAQTFIGVDEALADQTEIEPLYSGTTACVVLMRNRTLHIANVGDSRAVLARRKRTDDVSEMVAIDLSTDQNPDSPGEQERIERCGGFVSPPPEEGLSARVWLDPDFTHIGLAMSRSIGDHAVKSIGVISEPVVTSHTLTDEDEFIIIATDGVWEFIESAEAVGIVSKHLEANKGANAACQALIEKAALRWQEHEGDYRDDITAVVVKPTELWETNEKQ